MGQKWSKEKAWEWYNSRPWIRGFNYISCGAVNRIEQWQEFEHDRIEECFRVELKLAHETGFNAVRSILPYEVWGRQHDSFMKYLETYLEICAENEFGVMICFGNDCTVPAEEYKLPEFGPQHVDYGYHGGMARSPHDVLASNGKSPLDVPEYAEDFCRMVDEIVGKYAKDERVIVWDIFNEIGNSRRGMLSVPWMERFFEIARSHDPIQPLTACAWTLNPGHEPCEPERIAMELSDVISYHDYRDYQTSIDIIDMLQMRYDRPLFNTEWLHRMQGNKIQSHLPLFYLEKIACFNWGLVVGKSQNNEPWEAIWRRWEKGEGENYDFTQWQHELFRPNLRPYDPKELRVMKKYFEKADERFKMCKK